MKLPRDFSRSLNWQYILTKGSLQINTMPEEDYTWISSNFKKKNFCQSNFKKKFFERFSKSIGIKLLRDSFPSLTTLWIFFKRTERDLIIMILNYMYY